MTVVCLHGAAIKVLLLPDWIFSRAEEEQLKIICYKESVLKVRLRATYHWNVTIFQLCLCLSPHTWIWLHFINLNFNSIHSYALFLLFSIKNYSECGATQLQMYFNLWYWALYPMLCWDNFTENLAVVNPGIPKWKKFLFDFLASVVCVHFFYDL